MPNDIRVQRLIDATNRARFMLTGFFDGASGQEAHVIKIDTWGGISGALSNASNTRVLLTNAVGSQFNLAPYNVAVSRLEYTISPGAMVNLAWQGSTSNVPFLTLFGSGEIDTTQGVSQAFDPSVSGLGGVGHTGNIVLSTINMAANAGYTIIIDIKKDPKKFNQGQIERPKDFNIILATGNNA